MLFLKPNLRNIACTQFVYTLWCLLTKRAIYFLGRGLEKVISAQVNASVLTFCGYFLLGDVG